MHDTYAPVLNRLFVLYPQISTGKSAPVGFLEIVTEYICCEESSHSLSLSAISNKFKTNLVIVTI